MVNRARPIWVSFRRPGAGQWGLGASYLGLAILLLLLLSQGSRAIAIGLAEEVLEIVQEWRSPSEAIQDGASSQTQSLAITHGVASGEVTADGATIWARADGPAWMHVAFGALETGTAHLAAPAFADASTDFTATIRLEGLAPGTAYGYRVWFEASPSSSDPPPSSVLGGFHTAAAPAERSDVSFVFSGDLGGAGYCRRVDGGYRIFAAMEALQADFFVAAGDMIYADNTCPAEGPGWRNEPGRFRGVNHPSVDWTDSEALRALYRAHWRYNRADPAFQSFLRGTSMYVQWDDHEVINNSGASWSHWRLPESVRPGYRVLAETARSAFLEYAPLERRPTAPPTLYRSVRWGADLELFLLDTRSYRSRNDLEDTPENAKTMLGADQLLWLMRGLGESTATWKVVASGVPLSAPTGGAAAHAFGRDGWANGEGWGFAAQTGFERELLQLVRFLDAHRVQNVVFIAADLHRPLIVRYTVDANGDGVPLVFDEIVAGPLSATPRDGPNPSLDPTLNPTIVYGEGGFFNFAYVRVRREADGQAYLVADVRDEDGQPRPGSALQLAPRQP